ncbi:MAG: hypothetical protein Q4G05_02325 [Clostridia bacterium]|nr:hypothetical protein [Clostridia bacterium]
MVYNERELLVICETAERLIKRLSDNLMEISTNFNKFFVSLDRAEEKETMSMSREFFKLNYDDKYLRRLLLKVWHIKNIILKLRYKFWKDYFQQVHGDTEKINEYANQLFEIYTLSKEIEKNIREEAKELEYLNDVINNYFE